MNRVSRLVVLGAVLVCAATLPWAQGRRNRPRKAEKPPVVEQVPADATPLEEFTAIAERVEAGTNNQFLGPAYVEDLRRKIAAGTFGSGEDTKNRVDLVHALLRDGEIEAAIHVLDPLIAAFERGELTAIQKEDVAEVVRTRALAHLRQAEVQNCVTRHVAECCIYPLAGGGLHAVDAPARAAKQDYLTFLRLIEGTDRDRARLSAMWLLHIADMALGGKREGIPEAFRLPPTVPESTRDIGSFVDVASDVGLDSFDLAGGAVVDDFDGDGLLDVVTSTCDPRGPLKAFRNRGDGRFEDVSRAWKLDGQLGGLHLTAVDYDNDGRLDLFVSRGAWLYDHGYIRNSLLHNEPDGFVDVTRVAGVAEPALPTQVGVWADFDNDGWLDVYTASESSGQFETGAPSLPSQLFRSNGDGTFTDVAREVGVTNERFAKGACAGDYDGDGDMDLFVSNFGRDRLYRNELSAGKGLRFEDVSEAAGVVGPLKSFASWFFDYDEDGDLDLWICAYEARTTDVVLSLIGTQDPERAPFLYRNRGDGTFENVARAAGVERTWLPMGASFGDLDEDGWLDVYLGTGDPNYETLTPNIALRNDGGARFEEVTRSTGLGHLQKGHGVVFADLDDDGDQDIFHQLGGFYRGDGFKNALFLNPGHGRHWVKIELVGVETNRQAIGARLEVELETTHGPRVLHRAVGSVSSFGNAPRRQELGLGDATAIREVRVLWPKTGRRQAFAGMALDTSIRITEGKAEVEVVPLHPQRLGREKP
jgi:hypothetical protein